MNYELRNRGAGPPSLIQGGSSGVQSATLAHSKADAQPQAAPTIPTNVGLPRDIYERTFEFALRIVKLCQMLESTPGVSRTIGRQLLRSGTSVGANIQEGKSGQSRKDFLMKFHIARKEARETLYWLRLLAASDIVNRSRLTPLTAECNELVAILTTIIKRTQEGSEKA